MVALKMSRDTSRVLNTLAIIENNSRRCCELRSEEEVSGVVEELEQPGVGVGEGWFCLFFPRRDDDSFFSRRYSCTSGSTSTYFTPPAARAVRVCISYFVSTNGYSYG